MSSSSCQAEVERQPSIEKATYHKPIRILYGWLVIFTGSMSSTADEREPFLTGS